MYVHMPELRLKLCYVLISQPDSLGIIALNCDNWIAQCYLELL